jgi:hypothetical protein
VLEEVKIMNDLTIDLTQDIQSVTAVPPPFGRLPQTTAEQQARPGPQR